MGVSVMFSFESILSLIVSLLTKLADLLIQWRKAQGEEVIGVGDVFTRIETIVDRYAQKEYPGLSKDEANAMRRKEFLEELKVTGIGISERYARWMLESVLIAKEAKAGE